MKLNCLTNLVSVMKTKFMYLAMAVLTAAMFTGCVNEIDEVDGPGNEEGKETYFSLKIFAPTGSATTRGATEDEGGTPVENYLVPANLKMYVFNTAGTFESQFTNSDFDFQDAGNGVWKAQNAVKMMSGDKFVYIFNDPKGLVTPPVNLSNRVAFEKQEIPVGITGNNPENLTDSIDQTTGEFFMGTLWGKKINIASGHTKDNPGTLSTDIGRVGAKINLRSIKKGVSTLKGDFSEATYRLRTVPNTINLVGQWTNPGTGKVPGEINAHGIRVFSWAHDFFYNADDDENITGKYEDYAWDTEHDLTVDGNANYKPFYTVENTNKIAKAGTSTYIQIRIKYTPHKEEVYTDGGVLIPDASTVPATYYTYEVNGTRKIFDKENPLDVPGIDLTSGLKYTDGIMYYLIYIRDKMEEDTDEELYYRVLRNHFYDITVSNITQLGRTDEKVDPWEEPEKPTYMNVEINILKWSKVSDDLDL